MSCSLPISGGNTRSAGPILGTRASVTGFTRDKMLDYYRSVYSPGNLLITAAGNLEHERLEDLARACFESLEPHQAPRRSPLRKPTRASRSSTRKNWSRCTFV